MATLDTIHSDLFSGRQSLDHLDAAAITRLVKEFDTTHSTQFYCELEGLIGSLVSAEAACTHQKRTGYSGGSNFYIELSRLQQDIHFTKDSIWAKLQTLADDYEPGEPIRAKDQSFNGQLEINDSQREFSDRAQKNSEYLHNLAEKTIFDGEYVDVNY